MAKRGYTPETIIRKLREAEVLQGQGASQATPVPVAVPAPPPRPSQQGKRSGG
jgi:hypothetical protein